jgi:hypothetical protein
MHPDDKTRIWGDCHIVWADRKPGIQVCSIGNIEHILIVFYVLVMIGSACKTLEKLLGGKNSFLFLTRYNFQFIGHKKYKEISYHIVIRLIKSVSDLLYP